MLKILNVVQDFNAGGIQKLLLEYLRYFKGNPDIEYKVVVLESDRNSIFDIIAKKENLNIDYLNCHMSKSSHYYIRKISNYLCYNGRLSRYLKRNKPDIVHTHNSRIFKRIIGCIRKNINRYTWFHTLHSDPYAVSDTHIPFIKELLCGDKLNVHAICLNNTQFEKAQARYNLKQCDILYNVVDLSKFIDKNYDKNEIRKDMNIPDNAYVVGAVGRLDPVKNYGFLVKVFSEVVKLNSDAMLVFVGDGGEKDSLVADAKKLGIIDKIRFLGIRSDVEKIYRMFDVFVSTSITEASPCVVLEAQYSGVKCVVSDAIPIESVCTDKVVKMSKNATIYEWAKEILCPSKFIKPHSSFRDYSIEYNADKMVEIYNKALR